MRPFLLLPLLLLPLLLTPSLAHSPPKEEPNEELTLLRAAALGRREQALSLLSAGASPHATERPSGWTSLMHAAHSGDVLLTRALLLAGADINQGCADGWTPLMFAAVRGHVEVMRLLLQHRADLLRVTSSGATALGAAKLGGFVEAVRVVEEALSAERLHELIYEKEKGVEAVILSAAYSGDHVLVERLLREGHAPNTVSTGGWTPLVLAAAGGSLPTLQVLLVFGADVNMQDRDGWSPLMFCAHSANLPCVEMLLRAQADIFLQNKDGANVLQLARAEGHDQAFNLIVSMTYCHELLTEQQDHVDAMVRDGVDPHAIDCSGVRRVMEEHAAAEAAAVAKRVSDSTSSSEPISETVSEM